MTGRHSVERPGHVVAIEKVRHTLLSPCGKQVRGGGGAGIEVKQYVSTSAKIGVVLVHLAVIPRRVRSDQAKRKIRGHDGAESQNRHRPESRKRRILRGAAAISGGDVDVAVRIDRGATGGPHTGRGAGSRDGRSGECTENGGN